MIDAILEAHGQKRTRDEAFSDDDDDNVSSYWDWLPPEIQLHITSLAWRQHMRDMRSNQPFFNFLLREIHDYHTLTSAMNEGVHEHHRGHIIYSHRTKRVNSDGYTRYRYNRNYNAICPTIDICANQEEWCCYGCNHLHSLIYFVTKCGRGWFLGLNYYTAHINLKSNKLRIAKHSCERYNCHRWRKSNDAVIKSLLFPSRILRPSTS